MNVNYREIEHQTDDFISKYMKSGKGTAIII